MRSAADAYMCHNYIFVKNIEKLWKLVFWEEITLTKCKAKIHISELSKCMVKWFITHICSEQVKE